MWPVGITGTKAHVAAEKLCAPSRPVVRPGVKNLTPAVVCGGSRMRPGLTGLPNGWLRGATLFPLARPVRSRGLPIAGVALGEAGIVEQRPQALDALMRVADVRSRDHLDGADGVGSVRVDRLPTACAAMLCVRHGLTVERQLVDTCGRANGHNR